jgi:aminoglycoside phosphotransferase (APT) family kinase protein
MKAFESAGSVRSTSIIVDTESALQASSSRLTSLHSLSADDPPRAMEKTQRERFIEAARELECDGDEDALKARIKRLAETKPAPSKSLVKKPRRKPG